MDSPPARTTATAPATTPAGRRRTTARSAAARGLWWLCSAGFVLFFAVPIVWLVLAPTKSDAQIITGHPFALGSPAGLARTWHKLYGYQDGAVLTWIRNSTVYSFGALALTLVTSVPAGYALALTQFVGRKLLLTITLIVMIMPASVLVLPIYLEVDAVHLTGTIWSVVMPLSFFPFGVYLTYIYFSSTIPADVLAAARLDGCGEWQVFTRIALPLARPVIALVGFFSFVGSWNNFFLPFVMLPSSSQYPAQVGLSNLLASSQIVYPAAASGMGRPELALAALLTILPVLLVFLFSQRSLVSGMLAGASKE
ncbi:carbohydrate ABC transporter permease [Streptomyces sp. T028]|uniref:carbohydrate ABC transporter permease n=1 Tax=Streptomyces sp. T028 TaxID=3394379 RepID=UPI003A8C2D99